VVEELTEDECPLRMKIRMIRLAKATGESQSFFVFILFDVNKHKARPQLGIMQDHCLTNKCYVK